MGEVYWSAVDLDLVDNGGPAEHVVPPDRVPLPAGTHWTGAGSGWASYRGVLEQRLEMTPDAVLADQRVHALDVAVLGAAACRAGRLVSAEHALPVYLRDEVAWKKPTVSAG
jgi:tRNA threonylcarbamoyladenosine biosynthesis protein TsaB